MLSEDLIRLIRARYLSMMLDISKMRASKVDSIRNAKIGYIFQNFNLLDRMTVFENVAIALRMIGIKDKHVIKERVNYCLKSVGIYQFRNKTTDALSGGQRQALTLVMAALVNPNSCFWMNILRHLTRKRVKW